VFVLFDQLQPNSVCVANCCVDDLVVIADSEEEVIRKLNVWKEGLDKQGVRLNMSKTKLIVGRETA